MSQFPIDVDSETIFFDGSWYTREDLSRRIRAMLDQGDFNVARPSAALQELTQMLQGVRTLAFRTTPDLADALAQYAQGANQTVGAVIREAVAAFLSEGGSAVPQAQPQAVAPRQLDTPVAAAPAPAPAPASSSTTNEDLPKVIIEPQPMVVAGPGALRAAGVEPATDAPVELTQRKQPAPDADPANSEQRWFKQ